MKRFRLQSSRPDERRVGREAVRHKTGLLSRLAYFGAAGRGCCFTLHRVVQSEAWEALPNREFYVDLAYLERLIRHVLATGWRVVRIDQALELIGQRDKARFVNFSIDDVYPDTLELAVPLFRRLGVPVTLFVATGIPDRTMGLPFAGLETILKTADHVIDGGNHYPLRSDTERRAAFVAISARWDCSANVDRMYAEFCRSHGFDVDQLHDCHAVTWPMLEQYRDDPLVEFGGHTVLHKRISALSEDTAFDELSGCKARLEEKLGRRVAHFAFPYGRTDDCGPRDFALARAAGFTSAATTRKGLIGADTDPFRLPRNTLNGAHRALPYAYAHLSGASGYIARLLGRD